MGSARGPRLREYWRSYVDEAPRIAATLTTAAILFVVAVIFRPAIQRLFSPPAPTYPISCSADPVTVDAATGRTSSSFFIFNRADEELDQAQLARHLTAAIGGHATPADSAIILQYGGYIGEFLRAQADPNFNGDKGDLDVSLINKKTIRINIKRIRAAAVLKVDIMALQSPPPPILSRDMKAALPFENRDYEQTCYRG